MQRFVSHNNLLSLSMRLLKNSFVALYCNIPLDSKVPLSATKRSRTPGLYKYAVYVLLSTSLDQ